MSSHTDLITAEQLWRTPNDGQHYELVEGELRMMSPAGSEHGKIAVRITWRLAQFVEDKQLGAVFAAETGFMIGRDPDTVRAPDVAFVRQDRLDEAGEIVGYWPGAPDLAVEVLSPSDNVGETEQKALAWLDAGCQLVLVVDLQKKCVTVYRGPGDSNILDKSDTLDGGTVVPGWSLPVADIFK